MSFLSTPDPPPLVSAAPSAFNCGHVDHHQHHSGDTMHQEIEQLKYVTYGIAWPVVCLIGILGNVLNLVVLNQRNMRNASAYVYMRGYSTASLLAILVAIPFAVRVLERNEHGPWTSLPQAIFHVYLELYLGNSLLGTGVWMLVALTIERFLAVCHPDKTTPTATQSQKHNQRSKKPLVIVCVIPIAALLLHSPHLLRTRIRHCVSFETHSLSDSPEEDFSHAGSQDFYYTAENRWFTGSVYYLIYRLFISLTFRLGPTLLLAYLNLRIVVAYRRTCNRRRAMTRRENKRFAEESRLMLLLGSTSVLFFLCVTPMVILSLLFATSKLHSFPFQVFRSLANVLELLNYSLTFYIYCLFSKEFRTTFLGLFTSTKSSEDKNCCKQMRNKQGHSATTSSSSSSNNNLIVNANNSSGLSRTSSPLFNFQSKNCHQV